MNDDRPRRMYFDVAFVLYGALLAEKLGSRRYERKVINFHSKVVVLKTFPISKQQQKKNIFESSKLFTMLRIYTFLGRIRLLDP